jgi:hypothetical protein
MLNELVAEFDSRQWLLETRAALGMLVVLVSSEGAHLCLWIYNTMYHN